MPTPTTNKLSALHQQLPQILAVVFVVYLIEVIIGGPGQWRIADLPPLRHMLFALLASVYFLDLVVRRMDRFDVVALAWMAALLIIWGVIVPYFHNTPPGAALSDSRSLFAAMACPVAVRLMRAQKLRAEDYGTVLYLCACFVVILHVLIAVNLYIYGHRTGQDAAEFFFCLHTQCSGVYVGGMPGGGLRVHWIGSIFLVYVVAEAMVRRNALVMGMAAFAIYFSWSRSLWISILLVVVGMMIIMRRRFPFHYLVLIAAVFIAADIAVTWRANGGFEFSGKDQSEYEAKDKFGSLLAERVGQDGLQIRIIQARSHLRALADHPLMGTGFGVGTDVIRSSKAPWSYESTYTALAYKLGVIGMTVALVPAILLWRRLRGQANLNENQKRWLLVAGGVLLVSGFNPYLMNSVGITFIAVLYAMLWCPARSQSA